MKDTFAEVTTHTQTPKTMSANNSHAQSGDAHDEARCAAERALSVLEGRWKLLILRELFVQTRRFGELQKALGQAASTSASTSASENGISAKVLSQTLREMERDNLISRTVFAQVPLKVEYSLTEHGRSLKTVLAAMHQWGKSG